MPLAADEVELAAVKFLVEFAAQADGELEVDQRMRTDELLQYFRQARCHEILRRAKAQPTAQRGGGKIALSPLVRGQDISGEFDHGLAIGRHGHRMGVADEEPTPGFLLELVDVLADSR